MRLAAERTSGRRPARDGCPPPRDAARGPVHTLSRRISTGVPPPSGTLSERPGADGHCRDRNAESRALRHLIREGCQQADIAELYANESTDSPESCVRVPIGLRQPVG